MSLIRACLDRRVLAALAVTAVVIVIFAPQLIGAAIPLLIVAACPLSMVVMMATMRHGDSGRSPVQPHGADAVREELATLARRRTALESELAALDAAPLPPRGGAAR